MSRHRLSILRDVAFVTLALAGGLLGLASSAEAEDSSAAAEKTSVAHVGYAYRFIKHANEKMVWAFTPHASFSAGGSINRSKSPVFPAASAAVGGRVGVNVDFHIQRFLMGWAVEYEGLHHVQEGPLVASHFLAWTLVPIFRIGVDLGPTIQSLAH
jgi:hypothetical protein